MPERKRFFSLRSSLTYKLLQFWIKSPREGSFKKRNPQGPEADSFHCLTRWRSAWPSRWRWWLKRWGLILAQFLCFFVVVVNWRNRSGCQNLFNRILCKGYTCGKGSFSEHHWPPHLLHHLRQYLPHQDPDAEPPKTMREIEEEKQAEKDAQQRKVFVIVIIFFTLMIQMT